MRSVRPLPARPLAALLALLAPAAAAAFNPESIFLSPEAALAGGAVLAADDAGGAGWYNPAALGGLRRSSVQLAASAYSVHASRLKDALVTQLPWETTPQSASDTSYGSVPSVLAYSMAVRPGLGVAAGIWTPSASDQHMALTGRSTGDYPDPAFPGVRATYEQHYALSHHADDTWVGAAVGWQALPGLRLGAALQGAYATSASVVDLQTSITTTSQDPLQQGAHVNVSIRSDESMVAGRALLGVQWDATGSLRLALVVRTPAVRVLAWGTTTHLLSASVLLPGYAPQVGQVVRETSPEAGLSVVDVGRLSGGLAWTGGAWDLRADGDWSPVLFRRDGAAHEAWGVRAGALHRWGEDVTLGAGAFREGARLVASQGHFALDTYGATVGLAYRSAQVVKALGGGHGWDLVSGLAARVAYGTGHGPGMTVVPFDLAQSQLPILFGQGERGFLEVPARTLDGSLHVFTTLSF